MQVVPLFDELFIYPLFQEGLNDTTPMIMYRVRTMFESGDVLVPVASLLKVLIARLAYLDAGLSWALPYFSLRPRKGSCPLGYFSSLLRRHCYPARLK